MSGFALRPPSHLAGISTPIGGEDPANIRVGALCQPGPKRPLKWLSASDFRDAIGASRKFAIAFLDWTDRTGVTLRIGDARRRRR